MNHHQPRPTSFLRGFADVDCPACRGIGETSIPAWDRTCKNENGRQLRCRRCRGTGLL
ncbi:hypothetical protein KIH74_20105 [Kineosporia sp. J2-2]|uniref:Molecular chaperone DnaJ n=1 Tax=Kineosporia corallincola TaxID=2835133 RepID=A0ABS5TLK5_9ACTN|nr:hypothetical protein [Kineosporia corallincola]MBT0771254.1 hypothetical protein [Kineosporia corallincola]